MRVIRPRPLHLRARGLRAIREGLDAAAEALAADFDATMQTWSRPGRVEVVDREAFVRRVQVDSEVWAMLDAGTRPHVIRPRRARRLRFATGYTAKTIPGRLTSRSGGASGPVVLARVVRHPGTAPRAWIAAAKAKYGGARGLLAVYIRRALERG